MDKGIDLPTLAGVALGIAAPGRPEAAVRAVQTFQGFQEFEERRHARESLIQEREERRQAREQLRTFVPKFVGILQAGTPEEFQAALAGIRPEDVTPETLGAVATLFSERRREAGTEQLRQRGAEEAGRVAQLVGMAKTDPTRIPDVESALARLSPQLLTKEGRRASESAMTEFLEPGRLVRSRLELATAGVTGLGRQQEIAKEFLGFPGKPPRATLPFLEVGPSAPPGEPPLPGSVQAIIPEDIMQFMRTAAPPGTAQERVIERTALLGARVPEAPPTGPQPTAQQDAIARAITGVPFAVLMHRTESGDPEIATAARGQLRLVTSELQGTRNEKDRLALAFYGPVGTKKRHADVFSFDDLARIDAQAALNVDAEVEARLTERAKVQATAQAEVQLAFEKQKPVPLDEIAVDLQAARKNPLAPLKRVTLLTMGEARERQQRGEIGIVDPTLFRQLRGLDAATPVFDEVERIGRGLPPTGGLGPLTNRVLAPFRRVLGIAGITTEVDAAQGFNLFMGRVLQGAASQLSNRDVEMAAFLNVNTSDSRETLRIKIDIGRRLIPRFKLAMLGVDLSESSAFTENEAQSVRQQLLRDVIQQELRR